MQMRLNTSEIHYRLTNHWKQTKRAAKCIKKYSNIKKRKYEVEDIILTDNDKMQYDRALEGRNSARRVVLQKFQKEKSKLNYFKFFLLLVQWWWRAFNKVHFFFFHFLCTNTLLKRWTIVPEKTRWALLPRFEKS